MQTLKELFEADKTIPVFSGWSKPEDETGYSWFNIALDIQGVTQCGLFLQGGCYPDKPDCHVSFELYLAKAEGRRRTPISRLDWRAPSGHSNRRLRGHPHSGRRVSPTHLHGFADNWREKEGKLLGGNLPMACDLEPLESFEMAREFAGKSFKISNIDIVPRPEWVYDLFN